MNLEKILIATHNKGKFMEIQEIMDGTLPITFLNLDDIGITEDVHESGETFAENARIKAEFFGNKSGLPTIADDSGIIIEALKDELGVKTRRWGAGPKATDAEWIEFFLKRMESETNKDAEFICNAALYLNGETKNFEGITQGIITETLEAEYLPGLPLSACFKPIGQEKVFSALSIDEKNDISHRGKAFQQVKDYIKSLL